MGKPRTLNAIIALVGFIVILGLGAGCRTPVAPLPTRAHPAGVPARLSQTEPTEPTPEATTIVPTQTATPTPLPTATPTPVPTSTATSTPSPTPDPGPTVKLIGFSSQGYAIEGWQFGNGPNHLVFVGGIHGGYEWNTILLAYQMLDFFGGYPEEIPAGVTLTIIPSANPDGQLRVLGTRGRFTPDAVPDDTAPGRFNGNQVDLNRNWDCDWSPTGRWGQRTVSAGSAPFSEPETTHLRDFLLDVQPRLVVFWHSALDGVFTGDCAGVQVADTMTFAQAYAAAGGYPLRTEFTAYPITGDATNYLNRVGIPAFTVELVTHYDTDWSRNLAGMRAILAHFR